MMSTEVERLIEKVRALPPEQQEQVSRFVESLEGRKPKSRLGIFERIDRIVSAVPLASWAELPADGSDNVDHYVYGTPKEK